MFNPKRAALLSCCLESHGPSFASSCRRASARPNNLTIRAPPWGLHLAGSKKRRWLCAVHMIFHSIALEGSQITNKCLSLPIFLLYFNGILPRLWPPFSSKERPTGTFTPQPPFFPPNPPRCPPIAAQEIYGTAVGAQNFFEGPGKCWGNGRAAGAQGIVGLC